MRTYQSKFDRGQFVAWDGEGITHRKRHDYVLFANSLGQTISDKAGVSTVDVLDMLLAGFDANPRAVHVGFAISYDVNMLLKDVPKRLLKLLWEYERVEWSVPGRMPYRLQYRPRKFFRVSQSHIDGRRVSGTWWDVWPFFQSSFVRALEKYGVGDERAREEMARMKGTRASFTVKQLQAIRLYNANECRDLVTLMERLRGSLHAAGLTVKRWDGPGAIAAELLSQNGYKAQVSTPPPDKVLDAAQYAYYGGRIECVRYGDVQGPVYHYDINSAYPAAMRTVPCHAPGHGRWVHHTAKYIAAASGKFSVYHVRWDFPKAVMYPFPWRASTGHVYFPQRGEGWVWWPELWEALLRVRSLTLLEAWTWEPTCVCPSPFAWIDDVYEEREAAKRRGDAAEHALKLGLNSLYGKLAQRVGGMERDGVFRPPPFHDLAAAGWITSTVRAQLYRAAMQQPGAVLMLATDAVYSTKPLTVPTTPGEKVLGEWTAERHAGVTIVQSGVYIIREDDGREYVYSRGFDMASIERPKILAGWKRQQGKLAAYHQRFIGMGAALQFDGRWKLWRTWQRERRDLSLHPWGTKRIPATVTPDPVHGPVKTVAANTERLWGDTIGGRGRMTTPSAVPWRLDPGHATDDRADMESEDATL